ncbi:MAG TPA: hypothetical protein VFV42_05735 [Acidimicrobiales bacterium]|nr:hypothetical protein [Acidimicrobiales bacterium]
MRLQRLVVGTGDRTLAADLHPRLTVIGGLEPASREALVGELLDCLAGHRPGVHLELELGGRELAVFRPAGGRHRVIDTGSVEDVTAAHVGADGQIDLFASVGVDRTLARRTMRFGREDLVVRSESDAWVARLARADQEDLWETAMRCRAAEHLLEQAAAGGLTADDAPVVQQIEERHAALVEATDTYERIRLIALTISTVGALGAVGMLDLQGKLGAIPFVLVALAGAVLALRYRRAVDEASRAEREVLRRVGADDYTTFHYERVSALLDTDRERRRFMQAVGDHRRAMGAWESVAGPVPLGFALEHERVIRRAAAGEPGTVEGPAPTWIEDGDGAELASVVRSRLDAVRALTSGPDVLPLVVDDAFEGIHPDLTPGLLRLLAARTTDQQVIVVTADDAVVAWARDHLAEGGDVAIVEPTITVDVEGAGTGVTV